MSTHIIKRDDAGAQLGKPSKEFVQEFVRNLTEPLWDEKFGQQLNCAAEPVFWLSLAKTNFRKSSKICQIKWENFETETIFFWEKFAIWFPQNYRGWDEGRLDFFQKIIRFGFPRDKVTQDWNLLWRQRNPSEQNKSLCFDHFHTVLGKLGPGQSGA